RPSLSGSPRSRITTSGCCAPISRNPSPAVAASSSRYPLLPSVVRRKRLICESSSITSTSAPASEPGSGCVSILGFYLRWLAIDWQRKAEQRAAPGAVLRPDAALVRLDDTTANRQPQPDPAPAARVGPVELIENMLLATRRQPRPAVGHADGDAVCTGLGA